jgi:hypothetical protein
MGADRREGGNDDCVRMLDRASAEVLVQDALSHLHDPTRLEVHPLAAEAPGDESAMPHVSQGKALRERLLQAIEELRPPAGAGAARGHRLLVLRYVEELPAVVVRRRLAVSKSQFYRDHAQAVRAQSSRHCVLLTRFRGLFNRETAPRGGTCNLDGPACGRVPVGDFDPSNRQRRELLVKGCGDASRVVPVPDQPTLPRGVRITLGDGTPQKIAAHEFGHLFGLSDEYAQSFNPVVPPGQEASHSGQIANMGANGPAGALVESNDNIMSEGNAVRAQHYSVFLDALRKVTGLKEWELA